MSKGMTSPPCAPQVTSRSSYARDSSPHRNASPPHAVQMPPNYPANVGADAIRGWSGGMLAAFRAEFSLSPEEVQPAGTDWAFERGTYAITLTPRAGGDAIRDAGKYITLYQRQADGAWLMARDIWNSNNPLPG
jgi:ketosteroid isomerase-like protein